MNSAFVFIVWDDNSRWDYKIKTELNKETGYKPRCPTGTTGYGLIKKLGGIVYGFGEECLADLRSYGLDPIPMTDDTDVGKCKEGQFRKRYLCLADAFTKYDRIVSMDIDCIMLTDELPADFWERLDAGPPMQYPLLGPYNRPKMWWRPEEGQPFISTSCWFYMREKELAAEMLELIDEHHGDWNDEHGASWMIDQRMGGWKGRCAYKEAGYDPPFIRARYSTFDYSPTPFVH